MTKQFAIGDVVEVLVKDVKSGPDEGHIGKVLGHSNGFIGVSFEAGHDGCGQLFPDGQKGWWLFPSEIKLVEPKPKKQSKKITVDEVQVGDLIVAFRDSSGVETRRKGVVGYIDDKPRTKEGNILTHFYTSHPTIREVVADHIYLLERPEPKVPEIVDGIYWVTEVGHKSSPWTVTVKHETANWEAADGKPCTIGYKHLLAIKSGKYEDGKTVPVTKFHTEKPEPTIQEQLDALGVKPEYVHLYLGSDVTYQFIGEGQVKVVGPYGAFEREAGSCDVESFKDGFFELVVPKELTDLEKFEQAGLIGQRFMCGNITYKVTKKGNIKAKVLSNPHDTWSDCEMSFETLEGWVDRGTLYKI